MFQVHLRQWEHNRRFLETIQPEYPDWAVTVVFYTALHAVVAAVREALGASRGGP